MFHTLRWRVAAPYLFLLLLSLTGLSLYLAAVQRQASLANAQERLLVEARFLRETESDPLLSPEQRRARVARLADILEARITLIGLDGVVLADSQQDPALMDNHLNRPEVQQALQASEGMHGEGRSVRASDSVGVRLAYVALPLLVEGRAAAILRLALPVRAVATQRPQTVAVILGMILLALVASVWLARLVADPPLRRLRQATEAVYSVAGLEWGVELFAARNEIDAFSQRLQRAAAELVERLEGQSRERQQLETVLTYMADGVLITDREGEVLLINPAAARMLDAQEKEALGSSFARVVRQHQLIELWQRCQKSGEEQFEAIEISSRGLFVQAIVTPLREVAAMSFLVILQDLTQIRRLETVRRDFLSNISHELRTPLASLKALVDTLRDGALEDPPAAERFLNRIEVEVDAMTQMVQELLELSRIESGQVPIQLRPMPVPEVLLPPLERLRPQAERAGLGLDITVPSDLPQVLADPARIQQVVSNLVHNAIKFTPSGGQIEVAAQASGEEVVISVRDTGVGIPVYDLPRIFERFYKADRARSGGGTGLGLAIAKHIVQAHGGRIWAESREGQGSVFSFTLLAYTSTHAATPRSTPRR